MIDTDLLIKNLTNYMVFGIMIGVGLAVLLVFLGQGAYTYLIVIVCMAIGAMAGVGRTFIGDGY